MCNNSSIFVWLSLLSFLSPLIFRTYYSPPLSRHQQKLDIGAFHDTSALNTMNFASLNNRFRAQLNNVADSWSLEYNQHQVLATAPFILTLFIVPLNIIPGVSICFLFTTFTVLSKSQFYQRYMRFFLPVCNSRSESVQRWIIIDHRSVLFKPTLIFLDFSFYILGQ